MESPVQTYLQDAAEASAAIDLDGATPHHIPALASVDPSHLGIALTTADGETYTAGDADEPFSMQSISKAFVYAMAIHDRGLSEVLRRIDVEPSGEAFNELSLEEGSRRPRNPMINAGAIVAHSLVGDDDFTTDERVERIVEGLSDFAGRRLEVDDEVAESEVPYADRNLAIAHMLRSYDMLHADGHQTVTGYLRQCAVAATSRDLSVMAATLANGGVNPITGVHVVSADVTRQVLSVMLTCGMYDSAGDWTTTVGIPAKSGVGGGILGALPGQFGLATYSPPLDPHGNSVRGIATFERLSRDIGMHLMDVPPLARGVIRSRRVRELPDGRDAYVYKLQGPLRFGTLEQVIRHAVGYPAKQEAVVVDLRATTSIDTAAWRILNEFVAGLSLDGYDTWLVGAPPATILDLPAGASVRHAAAIEDVRA